MNPLCIVDFAKIGSNLSIFIILHCRLNVNVFCNITVSRIDSSKRDFYGVGVKMFMWHMDGFVR